MNNFANKSMEFPWEVHCLWFYQNKMERYVVVLLISKFYKRFVDDIYRQRNRNEPHELFDKMNSHHPNIKLTIEISLRKFLDTKIF